MFAEIDTFVLSLWIGVSVGSVNAYFRYRDTGSFRAAVVRFGGWLLAFGVTGLIATPAARWLLRHVL